MPLCPDCGPSHKYTTCLLSMTTSAHAHPLTTTTWSQNLYGQVSYICTHMQTLKDLDLQDTTILSESYLKKLTDVTHTVVCPHLLARTKYLMSALLVTLLYWHWSPHLWPLDHFWPQSGSCLIPDHYLCCPSHCMHVVTGWTFADHSHYSQDPWFQ